MRGLYSGAGTRGVLKLSTVSKLVHPWQAYQNKYYDTKLRPEVEKAWKQYLSEVPEGEKPKSLFEFRNQLVQKLYEEKLDSIKEKIEKHCQAMKKGILTSDVNITNRGFQTCVSFLAQVRSVLLLKISPKRAIDKLPWTFQIAAQSVRCPGKKIIM